MRIDENRCSKCGVGFGGWFETEANGSWHPVSMLNGFIVLTTHQFGFLPCKEQHSAVAEGMALWPGRMGQMPSGKCYCHIPPSCYKHSMNPHVWACCQFIFWGPKWEQHLWERKPEKEVCLQHMKTFEILLKIQALRQLVLWKQSILQLVV